VQKEAAAWLAPNDASNAYEVVSIAELEKRININLFPSLSAAVKAKPASLPEPRIRKRK
jgi:endonuclease G